MKASENPKISVIMAVYNGLPYLKDAAKSILNQTYKNFEFIIVDDASTDESLEYLSSLKDRRIRLIKNNENLGLAASLNKALKIAKGEYIARMDADDISLPDRFKEQVNFLIKNPSTDLCGTWAKLIDEDNKVTGKVHKPLQDKDIKKMNKWITGMIHPTWIGRAKVFRQMKGYKPKYDIVEDYDFLIRAKEFKMANIGKELLLWRSVTSRRSQKHIQEMYKKSFAVKWFYFKKGKLGLNFTPILIRSFITTYLFPPKLKIYLNRKAGVL